MFDAAASTLAQLSEQIGSILNGYRRMLDDEFVFASGQQVPQAATVFDAVHDKPLPFGGSTMSLPDFLALVAYRYGFTDVRRVGHGGYAVVLGHQRTGAAPSAESNTVEAQRRVMRLVPDHHVQDVTGRHDQPRPFDVQLNAANEPIRDPAYPLLLSDLFLLPRHTTKLVFEDAEGNVIQAGGRPAILHCQLLPEVLPLNAAGIDQRMAVSAGDLLETALATLGAHVVDAHGGNGGVLVGQDGEPLRFTGPQPDGSVMAQYIPVVLDYGYYSTIGPKTLATVLVRNGVTAAMMRQTLQQAALSADQQAHLLTMLDDHSQPLEGRFAPIIKESGLDRRAFGRLLYDVQPPVFLPDIWIAPSEQQWRTTKEQSYPPLHDQARLITLYPAYDEILFPQRIEAYHFTLPG